MTDSPRGPSRAKGVLDDGLPPGLGRVLRVPVPLARSSVCSISRLAKLIPQQENGTGFGVTTVGAHAFTFTSARVRTGRSRRRHDALPGAVKALES
jgi:hypothetical protein